MSGHWSPTQRGYKRVHFDVLLRKLEISGVYALASFLSSDETDHSWYRKKHNYLLDMISVF